MRLGRAAGKGGDIAVLCAALSFVYFVFCHVSICSLCDWNITIVQHSILVHER